MTAKIKVLVVDDSATVRKVMTQLLAAAPDVEVIGAVADPLFAIERMKRDWPDVIVLDIEMPRMDGLTFLRRLMAERPTPVVICSSLTDSGTHASMQALAAGAVAVLTKPRLGVADHLQDHASDVVRAVRAASRAKAARLRPAQGAAPLSALPAAPDASLLQDSTDCVVAIGTSTGGTQALETILTRLPRTVPGIVIVQHMPERFTAAFAQRLDTLCQITVREAQHLDRVLPGTALIAPGGRHMQLRRSGAQYQVEVLSGPPVNRHCPSVDVLLRSVARTAGSNALGIILTGMGDDGARGLLQMREAGADTIAQDEATSVVYGMPKEAVKLGAVKRSASLEAIAGLIVDYGRRHMTRPSGNNAPVV
jgi:two-component system chemotaxis response regulator CheB